MLHRLIGLYFFLLMQCVCYAQTPLSTRSFVVSNTSDLTFTLQLRPFEGSQFSETPLKLLPGEALKTTLSSIDSVRNANGVIVFQMDARYVFSLVIKDAIVSVHGCKSKPVFFHPEEYVCLLTDSDNGEKWLTIQRPS